MTFEERITFLQREAAVEKCPLPRPAAAFMAQKLSMRSERMLKGVLMSVIAYASLTDREVTLDLVEYVLGRSGLEAVQ